MKKFIVIILILGLIIFGVSYFYILKPPPVKMLSAEILPNNTLFMVEIVDLEKSIESVKASKLGQELGKIDIPKVMRELEAPPETIRNLKEKMDDFEEIINSVFFKELFGRDVTIAVLPVHFDPLEQLTKDKFLSSIVLISHPKRRTEIIEFLSRVFAKKLDYKTSTYATYEIKSFELATDITVHSTFTDDLLLAALDLNSLKRCIDIKMNQQPPLSKNNNYQYFQRKLASTKINSHVYINIKMFIDNIRNLLVVLGPFTRERYKIDKFEDVINVYKGFNGIGLSLYEEGKDILAQKSLMLIDKSKIDPLYAKVYDIKPEMNRSIKMIPVNSALYYWTNAFDPSSSKDMLLKDPRVDEEKLNLIEDELKKLGTSIEELSGALGNQYGLIMTDVITTFFFPLPKIALFIEVKDQAMVENLIFSLVQNQGMAMQQEIYEGVDIKNIMLPIKQDIQPSYAFFNGFYIFAINPQQIKDMIDAYKSGNNITSDADFQAVNKGLIGNNNMISFAKFGFLIDKMGGLFEMAKMSSMATQDQAAIERSNIIADEVFKPLLEGLKVCSAVGTRLVYRDKEIEIDSYYRIVE